MRTVHLSVELFDAMQNMGNPLGASRYDGNLWMCDPAPRHFAHHDTSARTALAFYIGRSDHHLSVTCSSCLLLMREATEPVRYDALLERGLVGL